MCDGRRAETCTGKPDRCGGGEREAADDGDPPTPPPATISGPAVMAVYLHVARENAPARALYESAGFEAANAGAADGEIAAVEDDTDVPAGELLLSLRIIGD